VTRPNLGQPILYRITLSLANDGTVTDIMRRLNLLIPVIICSTPALADGAGSGDAEFSSLLLPLILIVAAAAAATFLVTRWKGSAIKRDGPLQMLHVLPLGPRERLVLVKAGSRYLVVGIAPGRVSRIAEFERLDEAAEALSAAPSSELSEHNQRDV
jgi:flagellar protein FliO/FliZ